MQLFAFDEIRRSTPTVYSPRSEEELKTLLAAVPTGRRATFRGGGQSFDGQSLNDDLVISLTGDAFTKIGEPQRDAKGFFITVGAGARWWDVLSKLARLGLFPPSMATAGDATVGGTLSADCVSRMSCIVGKEGQQVRSFRIVLCDGRVLDCQRDDPDAEKASLFNATIGGFGYLGAVIEVTFDLMASRTNPNVDGEPPVVLTRSTRHGATVDWHELLQALHTKMRVNRDVFQTMRARSAQTGEPLLALAPEWSALSIASFLSSRSLSANLLEQGFIPNRPLKRSSGGVYDKDSLFTASAERDTTYWPTLVEFALELGFPEGEFVDELFGWAFFLGNSTKQAKQMAHDAGKRLNFTQQSFALPCGHDERVLDTRPTRRFIDLTMARLHAADVRPVNLDFLYIPADQFLMSASRNLPSFVVTMAFSGYDQTELSPRIDELLRALSHDCRTLGGRVHLVKNVVADSADLRAMHGDAARELRKLKGHFDPRNVLRNDFFDRVFDA